MSPNVKMHPFVSVLWQESKGHAQLVIAVVPARLALSCPVLIDLLAFALSVHQTWPWIVSSCWLHDPWKMCLCLFACFNKRMWAYWKRMKICQSVMTTLTWKTMIGRKEKIRNWLICWCCIDALTQCAITRYTIGTSLSAFFFSLAHIIPNATNSRSTHQR